MRTSTTTRHKVRRGRRPRRPFRRSRPLPPPDPATRVEQDRPRSLAVERPEDAALTASTRQRTSAGLPMVAGALGIVVAAGSKFGDVIHLPSSSEVSVASFGVILVGLGVAQRFRPAPATESCSPEPVAEPVTPVDLPSLTGEIAGLLARLRGEYGLAYRTTTWLDDVLPAVGFVTEQPVLARDLLAVSALDAGGVRADVTALIDAYPSTVIIEAGSALLIALGHVVDACAQRDIGIGHLPQSDPSAWPATWPTRSDELPTGERGRNRR